MKESLKRREFIIAGLAGAASLAFPKNDPGETGWIKVSYDKGAQNNLSDTPFYYTKISYTKSGDSECVVQLFEAKKKLCKKIKCNFSEDHIHYPGFPTEIEIENIPKQIDSPINIKNPIKINYNLCIDCGVCEVMCPEGAIDMKEKKPPVVKDNCNGCFACIKICPTDAITENK